MKKMLVLQVVLSFLNVNFMHAEISVHFPHLFPEDPIGTEYESYELLKKNPIPNVDYLAVPWTILMKYKTLHTLPNIQLRNGFTICQHYKFEELLPLMRDMGITVVFTPHVERGKSYKDITVLPYPHCALNAAKPARKKNILYSFIGTESNQKIRTNIFRLPSKKDVVIIKRKSWGAASTSKRENIEYRDVLSRSRFALCPRGLGPSTIRFWEALKSGAIPVILADTFQLPSELDWTKCTLQIPEHKYHLVDEIIRAIPLEQELEMRAHSLLAYELYSGNNLVSTIRHFYDNQEVCNTVLEVN